MAYIIEKVLVAVLAALPLYSTAVSAQNAVSGPPVVLSCTTTKEIVIAGIKTQASRHFQAPGETVDEAEARFQLNWGGEDFSSCSDFRAIWRAVDGARKDFYGTGVDDLVQQLIEAGAPMGAVAKWKLERRRATK